MNIKNRVFHVISNTHWDREWRFPFQKNRQMLVEMIDKVLDILKSNPDYRAFHLDSQSIVLDDYLEVRPEKEKEIIHLVQANRLLIGPWYILPDEFHVGGETLVRNLLIGHKKCRRYGGVSKTGYSPFSWGQVSQLPQIYSQFGIDIIMFYRGVNSLDSDKAEFLWEGADGTRLVTSRFSTMPRYNFYFYIYRPVIHNEGFADVEYKWERGGLPFHFADIEQYDEDYYVLQPRDTYYPENIAPAVNAIIEKQAGDFTTPHVIWMEGHDSSGPNTRTTDIIRDIKKIMPDLNVVHSTLDDYTRLLRECADVNTLPIVKGERRSAQFDARSGNLYGYITSARTYLKQKNFEAEKWLQRYAEPLNSLAGIAGMDISDRYLDIAWNYLVQNSAHDSIGGCSLDEIHEDMMCRYKQVIEISRGVFDRACKHLAKNINLKKSAPDSIHLAALNTTVYKRDEVVHTVIDIPRDYDKGGFELKTRSGQTVPVQLIDAIPYEPLLEQLIDRPMLLKMKRYRAFVQLNDVPAFGFDTFEIVPSKNTRQSTKKIASAGKNGPALANKFLTVKINTNGTINVRDNVSGRVFKNIGYFYDEGEAGHAWVHKAVKPFVSTLNSKPEITISENGPLSAAVKINHKIKIYADDQQRDRKGRKVILPAELKVILRADERFVRFEITVDNTAESHRLRFMLPLGINAANSAAEGQFDVVERPVKRIDSTGWVEQPMYDYPMYHFVDLADDSTGAAAFVEGLTEYEVIDDEPRTLAITLFRGFKYIIAPSSVQDYSHQKGAQCLGRHVYKLALYPHSGGWQEGAVYEQALRFSTPLRLFQTGRSQGRFIPGSSFISIEPKELIFSSLKKAEDKQADSFVLRLYNPGSRTVSGKIKFGFKIKSASLVSLEENNPQPLKISRDSITIKADAKKILSVQFTV